MKTIDIIRPGSVNAIIGPVGTLKRILKNRAYFQSRGYDVSLFTDESISIGAMVTSSDVPEHKVASQTRKSKLKKAVYSYLRMHAQTNNVFAKHLCKVKSEQNRRLVDYYISLGRTPDVIQFHSDEECYFYLKNRKEHKAKTVMFLHTDGYPYKMLLSYYSRLEKTKYFEEYKRRYEWTVANVDEIVFIAKIGQSNFLRLFPNRSLENTNVIINGIDDFTAEQRETFNLIKKNFVSPFKYRLCCTGTINSRKGHRIIVEALHRLDNDLLSQIHVDFMGDGSERPVLEALLKEYGLENNVTFLGMVPNVDVYKHLAENNVYILMSRNEGLPISIIEAMRAGLPVISTNVSGIPELVEVGYNGYLLNPDVDELVGLLSKIGSFDIEAMGLASRTRFEKEFTFERMEEEFCNMYDVLA